MTPDALATVIAQAVQQATAPLAAQLNAMQRELDTATSSSAQYRALRRHFPAVEAPT